MNASLYLAPTSSFFVEMATRKENHSLTSNVGENRTSVPSLNFNKALVSENKGIEPKMKALTQTSEYSKIQAKDRVHQNSRMQNKEAMMNEDDVSFRSAFKSQKAKSERTRKVEPLEPIDNISRKRPSNESLLPPPDFDSTTYPKGWLIGKKRKLVNVDVVESMRRIAVQEMNRKVLLILLASALSSYMRGRI